MDTIEITTTRIVLEDVTFRNHPAGWYILWVQHTIDVDTGVEIDAISDNAAGPFKSYAEAFLADQKYPQDYEAVKTYRQWKWRQDNYRYDEQEG